VAVGTAAIEYVTSVNPQSPVPGPAIDPGWAGVELITNVRVNDPQEFVAVADNVPEVQVGSKLIVADVVVDVVEVELTDAPPVIDHEYDVAPTTNGIE
jgi:hypothetical protein